jgi:hypothetical protein
MKKNTQARKDASELLRFLIFGEISEAESDEHPCFKSRLNIGCRNDMDEFWPFWVAMDTDRSGRVDHEEFRRYAERRFRWQFLEKEGSTFPALLTCRSDESQDKFISGLCDKIAVHLLGKKSSMSIDDVIKLAWLCASQADVKTMKSWCKEVARNPGILRVSAPPVLPAFEYEGLTSIFRDLDATGDGQVTFKRLVQAGLLHDYQIPRAQAAWDSDGNGTLDEQEFCEMMCPLGFRASASSLVGSRRDGSRVVYDENTEHWRMDKEMTEAAFASRCTSKLL